MSTLIKFNEEPEYISKKDRRSGNYPTVYVNPSHVSAVLPRKRYTTLVVSGKYVHVSHLYQDVIKALGHDVSTTVVSR